MFINGFSRNREEKGQALLEFAFTLPILLAFILLILDGGFAMDERATVLQALREGARVGAAGGTSADVIAVTVAQSDGLLEAADVSVCHLDGSDSGTSPGDVEDAVRVGITHEYELVLGAEILSLFGLGFGALDISPTAEAALHVESPGASAC